MKEYIVVFNFIDRKIEKSLGLGPKVTFGEIE